MRCDLGGGSFTRMRTGLTACMDGQTLHWKLSDVPSTSGCQILLFGVKTLRESCRSCITSHLIHRDRQHPLGRCSGMPCTATPPARPSLLSMNISIRPRP